ncbi:MAG TPA: RNA polymerase factor sigma-54 [Xanthomonadaceae bacterium]|nr:RNA polymerase factor sigma-54 [Xanthomonadaceae bacterium]
MKPALQLRLGQQLTLTPQLRQAIRLLQLSAVELETEINLALESNPLLDRAEDAQGNGEDTEPGERPDREPEPQVEMVEDAPLDYEPVWDEHYSRAGGTSEDEFEGGVSAAEPENLHDHLMWQLNLTTLSPRDHAIAVTLIESIGDDGYLREDVEAIGQWLAAEVECGSDEIEAVLHRIQRFDPLGVGARDLSECLLVQLSMLPGDTPGLELAQAVAKSHLEELARSGLDRLAHELGVERAQMREAVDLLRSLDPKPGDRIASGPVEYVAPDAYVERERGIWRVRLAQSGRPKLAINRHYESLIGAAAKGDAAYLRGQLQEARWLIKSLETRADTLLRVAHAIVRHQTGFLEHGPEAMRPLTLREIAEELALHESTISRVTTRKYLHTPRGTFEFKHFFSSSLSTTDGGTASSTAIQAMIRRLVEREDPRRPLSDARLAAELRGEGVTVARRTVAKYREAMNIPSSNERQRLG